MQKVRLGRTNLHVGRVGVGCWAIGGPFINLGLAAGWDGADDHPAEHGWLEAVRMGANLFDTADVYGFGRSERLVGRMLRRAQEEGLATREQLVVATKVGYFQGCAEHAYDPLHMTHQLEMSLRNLSTDYIDIYWFHHLDFGGDQRYLPGAIDRMRSFQREGRVRFVGLRGPHTYSPRRAELAQRSDGPVEDYKSIAEAVVPDVVSLRYNALSHKYDLEESDLIEWAEKRDLGIVLYKPLAQGLLLDKYDPRNPPEFSAGDHRSRKAWFRAKGLSALRTRIATVKREFACCTTEDLVQLALRYSLSRSVRACVVVGFRSADQLRSSLSTTGSLSPAECARLREIFGALGEG